MNPNQCHREPTEEEKTKIKFYKQSNEPHKGQNMNPIQSIIAALCKFSCFSLRTHMLHFTLS